MTVTEEMVEMVSPYTVGGGTTDDITTATFSQFVTWTTVELDNIDPGLATASYDEAHANLIADRIWRKQGKADMKSESIGNEYDYTREVGDSSYMMRFNEIIELYKTTKNQNTQEGYTRYDANPSDSTAGNMKLDQGAVPTFD